MLLNIEMGSFFMKRMNVTLRFYFMDIEIFTIWTYRFLLFGLIDFHILDR